jgi:glucose/arabinose dehydrogenase
MQRRQFVLSATSAFATPAIVRAQETLRVGALKSAKASYRLVTLSRDLEQPWSIAFLPDGRLLITERPGRLRLFANGKLERTPLSGAKVMPAASRLAGCLPPSRVRAQSCSISPT